MGLFTVGQLEQINKTAKKSNTSVLKQSKKSASSINEELRDSSNAVLEYFQDSKAILITSSVQLHNYISECIDAGYVAIDTETTGIDRVKDYVVGVSLYYKGGTECYIPIKHRVPLLDELYKNQLTYSEVQEELQRLVDNNIKMIFANADYDLAMIYKDLNVDFCELCYYDVQIAWRCIKEDEKHNGLKELYSKYVLHGNGDPKKFSDFFSPKLFPNCKPDIAKLYAANDAKITYELYEWQLPLITKNNDMCKKYHLEHIADLIWQVEFPLIKVCHKIHRIGIYIDSDTAQVLNDRYTENQRKEMQKLSEMVQEVIDNLEYIPNRNTSAPFTSGKNFNPNSNPQVKYLLYELMQIPKSNNDSTGKEVLNQLNLPITNQILKVRSYDTLINTFVKKLPNVTTSDNRIHAQIKQLGAATGRLSCIAKGTKIRTQYRKKNIEDLEVGEYVCCLDYDNTFTTQKIINIWNNGERECLKIKYTIIGSDIIGNLICTYDHLILTISSEWVRAENLCVGDVLAGFNHIQCMITDIDVAGRCTVYDIEVENCHNFIANEICVHNCSEPNLMNIPSHADDIRHMFRATPAKNIEIECEDNEQGRIEITLSYYDKIPNDMHYLISVHNLCIGDRIKLKNENNVDVIKHILSIKDNKKDLSMCDLILGD